MRFPLPLFLLMAASPAFAWVPATVGTGCMDRWYSPAVDAPAVTMAVDSAGIGGIAATDVHTALLSALKTWNEVQCGLCTNPGGIDCLPIACGQSPLGVALEDGGVSPHAQWGLPCAEAEADGTFNCKGVKANGNWVIQVADPKQWQWSQFAAAQTVVTANLATGEIIDTDILFNLAPRADGTAFTFCDSDCPAKPAAYPLCIPLTHELGHVLGLNHSLVAQATMAASAVPADTYKCQLNPDDILGVCTLYRTTCSGTAGVFPLAEGTCQSRATASGADAGSSKDAADTSGGDGNSGKDASPFSCQASRRATSPWNLLWLLALTPIRLGWGKSRAKSR